VWAIEKGRKITFQVGLVLSCVLHKLAQLFIDETRANLYKKEHTQGREREKEEKDKDQSPGKQTAQKRRTTRRKVNH
jgi:hypothetical protein